MTITSIGSPNWVSYTVSAPSGGTVTDTIGLHRRCTSSTGTCSPFPDEIHCRRSAEGRSFCFMWRTTGFLMSFSAIMEIAAIVGFLIIMRGGKVRRQGGWKVLGVMMATAAAAEFIGMAVVAYLFDHDEMFLVPGYRLASSWYLCATSASVALLTAIGLSISALVLPPEDGYQLLDEPSGV
ncbi:uncharacterized protein B0T15DRAFT_123705 [Chaetomium strumarium]|uniref:Uncharacterized protein n=1 Tax=Chaetomium strumarium TaxID=1170767 RepID=A0AAJ0M4X7_9PEZI|nr:hypothetical protein B0T15DRAFT_123705 [Chaetomium strumarium]